MLFLFNLILSQTFSEIIFENLKLLSNGKFTNFEVSRNHFTKSEHFWPLFNLSAVIRRFCDVTNLTQAFCDSVVKTNLCTKFKPHVTSLKNDIIFQKYGCHVTIMTSSNQNHFF